MTENKLYKALHELDSDDKFKVLNAIKKMTTRGWTYRRSANVYFNNRLILLGESLKVRENLIYDGTDEEWCSRFQLHVLPKISKTIH